MYDLYNPTIRKIETLKLEKRLDTDLSYLVDALPEYSTFDFHMEPIAHPAGAPVPINPMKVCFESLVSTHSKCFRFLATCVSSLTRTSPWILSCYYTADCFYRSAAVVVC